MKRFTYRRGLKLGLSGLAIFAACITTTAGLTANNILATISFSGTTTLDTVTAVDLTQYSAYNDHKSKIAGAHLKSVVLTIPNGGILMDNNTPAITNGSVSLRPAGATDASQDVLFGSVTNVPITVGSTVTINAGTGSAVDTFLSGVVTGSGKFQVVINGAVQAASGPATVADFQVSVTLNVDLSVNIL